MRNPLKKEVEEIPEIAEAPKKAETVPANVPEQIVEREINLSLINDKLNYHTSLMHKIAEACDIKLDD